MDVDAIHQDIDKNGPYPKNLSGSLEPESLVRFKKVIAIHAYLNFMPVKEKMMQERLGHLQAKREKEY